jgi:sulfatase maturation enzyme AslB (radical SAM superfamily)
MAEGVGMKFSQLAFIVTDDCNYNCFYCPQTKENSYMKRSTIEKAVEFFYPFLDEEAYILFCGGEPLLAFDNIKYTVSLLQEKNREGKKLKFSLTTNGSLITDEVLHFFDDHCFDILLSFDGLAQDMRQPGSMVPIRELIRCLQGDTCPGIEFSINSVFTPETVNYLSTSLQYIIECGVTDLTFSLTQNIPWTDDSAFLALERELTGLTNYLVAYYKETGTIPVIHFRIAEPQSKSEKNVFCFTCAAGLKRIAITPEENIWGCYVFHDYLKNRAENPDFHTYGFGKLDNFIKNYGIIYPRILFNYTSLRQDCFFTGDQHCYLCQEVEKCRICPVTAAYTTSFIGKISPWVCRLHGIQRKAVNRFLGDINRINA